MFYIEENNKIVLFDKDRQKLENTLLFMPQYQGLEIKETSRPIENFQFADTEEYQQEQTQKERQRLDLLSLTKADVLLALYQDKGITPEDIKTMLKDNVPALIKFDYASSYYRGDEVVNALGLALGYTTEEMDYLFENKAFPPKVEEPTDTDSDTDSDIDTDTDNDTEQAEDENANTTDTDTNTVPDEMEQPSDTTEETDTDNPE